MTGEGLYEPPAEVVERARAASAAAAARFEDPPGPLDDIPHQARVLAGLFALAVLPGLLAAPFFGLRDTPSRIALIPGTSIVMSLLAGIAVLGVWRGPLTETKAWVVVGVAAGAGAALRIGSGPILRTLDAFGGFFNRLFSQFSNRDFAVLMSVQFLTQAGQGMIQGAIGKSIAFGGQEGFDVQNVPSADYLLKVILLLYVPYTLLSPFIGVIIDRFERRRVVWWSNLVTGRGRRRRGRRGPPAVGCGEHRGRCRRDCRSDRGPPRRAGRHPRHARDEVGRDPRRALGP